MTTKAGVDLGVEAALIEFVGRPTLRAERHFSDLNDLTGVKRL
jgi:hypothetical protein